MKMIVLLATAFVYYCILGFYFENKMQILASCNKRTKFFYSKTSLKSMIVDKRISCKLDRDSRQNASD